MGVALTYAGRPDDGLKALQQSNILWSGDISEAAMIAARKIIQAREEQNRPDALVAQTGQATEAAAVRAEAALIQLKKGGVTDAVVLALNEAQCGG